MSELMLNAFLGGCLIGIAATLLLYFNGKIAGNSGIVGGLLTIARDKAWWCAFYVAGLALGTVIYSMILGRPEYTLDASWPVVILAGLLVGYGTLLGGGCTSGHGICGLARFSKRSITATALFMLTAIVTVYFVRHVLGGQL